MKAESGIKPKLFNVDKVGENAVISLFDNVREVETQEDEVGIIYEYDYYSVEVPHRDGLELDVEYNYEKWLNLAIAKEGLLPTPNLEERAEVTEIELLNKKVERLASENEAKDDLLQEIILQIYQ